VAMAGGVGAYEAVNHTGIDAATKTEFNQPGAEWPSGVNEIGTLCGYGVCIVPFAVVGFLTHNATKYVDGVDNQPKSGIFRSALVGDVKYKGNDFQFKPSFLPGGGIGPSVTITLGKK
jgi:hypothetical protein